MRRDLRHQPLQTRTRFLIALVILALSAVAAIFHVTRIPPQPLTTNAAYNVPLFISCKTQNWCITTGSLGLSSMYENRHWTQIGPIPGETAASSALACASDNFCAEGDLNGGISIFRNGRWSRTKIVDQQSATANPFGPDGISALACPSSNMCLAGDARGFSMTYNGTSWSLPTPANAGNDINSISCPTRNFCFSTASDGTVQEWFQGHWLAPIPLAPTQFSLYNSISNVFPLSQVSCSSPTFCVVATANGAVDYEQHHIWSPLLAIDTASASFTLPSAPNANSRNPGGLTDISCPRRTFCAATDALGDVLTYRSGTWSSPVAVDHLLGLRAVSCTTKNFCGAIDYLGNATIFNGSRWTPLADINGPHVNR